MKYKGFIIEKVLAPGSTFNISKNGDIKPRRPRKEDTTYDILDPMEGMGRFTNEPSIAEAKSTIDDLLDIMGMPSNTPSEWDKL